MSDGDSSNDFDLFKKEMANQGVRKTTDRLNRASLEKQKPLISAKFRPATFVSSAESVTYDSRPSLQSPAIDNTSPWEPVLFVRQGADKSTIRAFRRGHIPNDETIDLHGMREPEARRALVDFFAECRRYKLRSVQIIHGKGRNSEQPGGVLKPLTIQWLKQQRDVVAFCSATERDGGTGATNVLLVANPHIEMSG